MNNDNNIGIISFENMKRMKARRVKVDETLLQAAEIQQMAGEQTKNPTMWASGKNPHKHRGGRQDSNGYAKRKKAKRRQQKQARRRNR